MIQIAMACAKTQFLRHVIKGLINQTEQPDLLLIGDNTEKGITKLLKTPFETRIIRAKTKEPWKKPFILNNLLDRMNTDQPVLILDDDLWLHPLFMERLNRIMDNIFEAVVIPYRLESKLKVWEIKKHGQYTTHVWENARRCWSVYRFIGSDTKDIWDDLRDTTRLQGLVCSRPRDLRFDRSYERYYGFEDVDYIYQHIARRDLLIQGNGCLSVHFEHPPHTNINMTTNTKRFMKKWARDLPK